jgi:hypothetical protein
VAVAGAGLGGLCLAQGLRRAGADVTVYERDDGLRGRRQGYRLHVDARAGLALQQCLPPDLLAAFQATCGQASTRLTVVSERLRVLKEITVGDPAADPYAPGTLSTSVNRLTLREVLAAGLDDAIVPGCEVTGYDADREGVRVHFADGREAEADVLVGADGLDPGDREPPAACRRAAPHRPGYPVADLAAPMAGHRAGGTRSAVLRPRWPVTGLGRGPGARAGGRRRGPGWRRGPRPRPGAR